MSALLRDKFIEEMAKGLEHSTTIVNNDWHMQAQLHKYKTKPNVFTKGDLSELSQWLVAKLENAREYNENRNIELHNLRIDVTKLKEKNKKLRKKARK